MKQYLRTLTALLTAGVLTLSLAACSGGTATTTDSSPESPAVTGEGTQEPAPSTESEEVEEETESWEEAAGMTWEEGTTLGSGTVAEGSWSRTQTLGEAAIALVGAEADTSAEGHDVLRLYYDYTNNGTEDSYARNRLVFSAVQHGQELETTVTAAAEQLAEYDNDWVTVRPGVTIRCFTEFYFDPAGDAVTLTVTDWIAGESLEMTVEPEALPILPDGQGGTGYDTSATEALPSTGKVNGLTLSIDRAELTELPLTVRVYCTLTNDWDEVIMPIEVLQIALFQEGVGLEYCYDFTGKTTETDLAYLEELQPGETTTLSLLYQLNGEGEFEVIASDEAGNQLGRVLNPYAE